MGEKFTGASAYIDAVVVEGDEVEGLREGFALGGGLFVGGSPLAGIVSRADLGATPSFAELTRRKAHAEALIAELKVSGLGCNDTIELPRSEYAELIASPEGIPQVEPISLIEELLRGLVPVPGLEDYDLADVAEAGVFIPGLLHEIRRRAALLTDDELLSVDLFEGDDGDVRILSEKVVRGRREHRDHWSGVPILPGEPHVVRKEVMDGEFLTTRHSRETLWMALVGGFGSQELARQVAA